MPKTPVSVQDRPFDHLELLGFLASNFDQTYAAREIAKRGATFVPDSKFLSVAQSFGVARVVVDTLKGLKPANSPPSSPDREAGFEALTRAVNDQVKRDYDSADELYKSALRLAPDSATLQLAYANGLLRRKKYGEAEIASRRGLNLWPDNPDGHTILAVALIGLDRDAEAVPEAREALKLFPGHKGALTALGMSLTRSKQYADAVPVLREGVKHVSEMPLLKKDLGVCLYRTGDINGGIKELKEYLEVAPNDAEAHYHLGSAYRAQGHADLALAQFREAARIEPNNPIYATVANPVQSSGTTTDSSESHPNDGFLSENVYTNTFFGFSYEIPKHWTVLPEYLGSALTRRGGAILANDDPVLNDFAEASARYGHTLLVASEGARKDGAPSSRSVLIRAFDTRLQSEPPSGEDLAKSVAAGLTRMWGNKVQAVGIPEELHISGTSLWRLSFNIQIESVVAHGTEVVTLSKGYLLFFIFTSRDQTGLDEITQTIYSLRFVDTHE